MNLGNNKQEKTEGKKFFGRLKKNKEDTVANNNDDYNTMAGSNNNFQNQNTQKMFAHTDSLTENFIKKSLQLNKNDMIDPLHPDPMRSLFFRLHVSGVIESANVFLLLSSFMKEMLYSANMILFMGMSGRKKMYNIII
jgi:hypothetical protein